MPAKKTAKKKAAKKVASNKGAVMPLDPWPIEKIVEFLQDNPNIGVGLHQFFEGRRNELLSMSWASANDNFDAKCAAVACYLTDEVLSLGMGKRR